MILSGLVWSFVVTGQTKTVRGKRIRFLFRRIFPVILAAFLLVSIIIPGVLGQLSSHARYLPQIIEAHKLRIYWRLTCLLPGISGSETDIQRAINQVADEYTMHPDLIRAVVRVESANNQFALSGVGACGLMQVMPNTYFSLRSGNPFSVKSNLRAGTEYLRSLYRRFGGNIELALAAYNAGPGAVAALHAVPAGEVRRYVDKVMHCYRQNRGLVKDSQTAAPRS